MGVPNFSDTGSDTGRKMKNSRYWYRYPLQIFKIPKFWPRKSVPVPNFSNTGSEIFFRYQIFPIPVPILFSGTNFFRYRFRYHQKNQKFPVPGIPGTGTSHSAHNSICHTGLGGPTRTTWIWKS